MKSTVIPRLCVYLDIYQLTESNNFLSTTTRSKSALFGLLFAKHCSIFRRTKHCWESGTLMAGFRADCHGTESALLKIKQKFSIATGWVAYFGEGTSTNCIVTRDIVARIE